MGFWYVVVVGDMLCVDSYVLVVGDIVMCVIELLGKLVYWELINNEYGVWLGECW